MSSRKSIASIGALLGSALAKAKKKKNTPGRAKAAKKKTAKYPNPSSKVMKVVHAPTNYGATFRPQSATHKTFTISGSSLFATLTTSSTAYLTMYGSAGTIVAPTANVGVLTVNVDVAGNSNTGMDFRLFPEAIYTLATTFLKYRVKKLKLHYVPSCPTTLSGQLLFATVPEPYVTGGAQSYFAIGSTQDAVCTPLWRPASFNALDNLDGGWHYCDTATIAAGALSVARQETVGALSIAYSGLTSATQALGSIFGEYEIEFDALAQNSMFGKPPPPPSPLIEEAKEIEPERYVQVPLTQPCTPSSVPPHPAVSGWFQPGASHPPPRL